MTTKARRWAWHEAAATDAKVSDSIARTVMILVGFANEESGLMSAAEATIAAKRRLSPKQVSRHLDKLVSLGYLVVRHKGGGTQWVKKAGGLIQVGRPTEYTITLPGHSACPSIESNSDISSPLPGHFEAPTRTFSAPYSDTLDVLGTTLEPPSNQIANQEPANARPGMGRKAIQDLPSVPFEMVSLWEEFWPKVKEVVEIPTDQCSDDRARTRVVHFAFQLLGWELRSADEDRPKWAAISDYLKGAELAPLVTRYQAGALTMADIAAVLACDGIVPPAMDTGAAIAKAS